MLLNFTFLLFCLVQYCLSESDLETKGLSISDSIKHKADIEYILHDKDQFRKEDDVIFDRAEKKNQASNKESGHYNKKDGRTSGYDIGKKTVGQSQAYDVGQNAYKKHNNGQERKGYHRSGFMNNYHKDESGNKSSFYEDSSDERKHLGHDSRDKYHDQRDEDFYRDGRYDSVLQKYDRANRGDYGKGERYNDHYGHLGNYNANNHDSVRENFLKDGTRRYFDRNGKEIYRAYHPHDFGTAFHPSDYRHYPQNFYPARYYPASNLDKGDSYNPINEGYGKSYDSYYEENRNYNNLNFNLPNNYY